MRDDVLKSLIKVNNNLVIPGYIVKNYEKLELEGLEFLLLIYFINQKDNVPFDLNKISSDLNISSSSIFDVINSLNEKNYITIEMKKNNGVIEEFVSTDLFYNKLYSIVIDNKEQDNNTDLYSCFEKELGRVLSPIEYETISRWIENGINEELIKEALKESVLSGAKSFRYIDTVLLNWTKKGYKTSSDVKRKKEVKEQDIEEVYDYDWLNE